MSKNCNFRVRHARQPISTSISVPPFRFSFSWAGEGDICKISWRRCIQSLAQHAHFSRGSEENVSRNSRAAAFIRKFLEKFKKILVKKVAQKSTFKTEKMAGGLLANLKPKLEQNNVLNGGIQNVKIDNFENFKETIVF